MKTPVLLIMILLTNLRALADENQTANNANYLTGVRPVFIPLAIISGLMGRGVELGYRLTPKSIIEYSFHRSIQVEDQSTKHYIHAMNYREFFGETFNVRFGLGVRKIDLHDKIWSRGTKKAEYDLQRYDALCDLTIGNEWKLYNNKFILGFDWIGGTVSFYKLKHKIDYQYKSETYVYDDKHDGTSHLTQGVLLTVMKMRIGYEF